MQQRRKGHVATSLYSYLYSDFQYKPMATYYWRQSLASMRLSTSWCQSYTDCAANSEKTWQVCRQKIFAQHYSQNCWDTADVFQLGNWPRQYRSMKLTGTRCCSPKSQALSCRWQWLAQSAVVQTGYNTHDRTLNQTKCTCKVKAIHGQTCMQHFIVVASCLGHNPLQHSHVKLIAGWLWTEKACNSNLFQSSCGLVLE